MMKAVYTPLEKGCFGYIDKKKKHQLIISLISLFMVFIICITGIIIYDTRKSIYAVLAALSSLPVAKMLVGYIVIMPYYSVSGDFKKKLESVAGDKENCKILYDVVLSSSDKAMYAGTLYIKNGKIYGFADKRNTKSHSEISLNKLEKHIKLMIDANCNYSVIKMFESEEKFLRAVENEKDTHTILTEEGLINMRNMNEKIKHQIGIYMF